VRAAIQGENMMENAMNTINDKFIVIGLFKGKDSAERAYNALSRLNSKITSGESTKYNLK
jgi:hypothetical protein